MYYQFGSKTGVLEALCDALAEAAQLTELRRAFEEPDPRGALQEFIVTFTRFWAVDRLVMRRLRALAALDPDVGAVIRARDDRHRQGLAGLTSRLAGGSTTPHPGQDGRIVQLLHALTGFEMFDSLAGPTMLRPTWRHSSLRSRRPSWPSPHWRKRCPRPPHDPRRLAASSSSRTRMQRSSPCAGSGSCFRR